MPKNKKITIRTPHDPQPVRLGGEGTVRGGTVFLSVTTRFRPQYSEKNVGPAHTNLTKRHS